jgi:hypothetical protein
MFYYVFFIFTFYAAYTVSQTMLIKQEHIKPSHSAEFTKTKIYALQGKCLEI